MGGMGAGDVKLLGVIGVLKGSIFVFDTFLWMAIWGGVIAVILLISKRQFKDTILRMGRGVFLARLGIVKLSDSLSEYELSNYFPYVLAIGLGGINLLFPELVVAIMRYFVNLVRKKPRLWWN